MISCCRHDDAGGTLLNSVCAANYCTGSGELYHLTLLSQGDAGCTFAGNGLSSFGSVTAGTIGPLKSNGGSTFTNALLAGGEASDTTSPKGCIGKTLTPVTTDQRGALKVAWVRCDVVALEHGSVVSIVDTIFGDGFEQGMQSR